MGFWGFGVLGFWEEFFGRIFWGEEFFGRNSLFTFLKSAKLLQIDLFVKILSKSKEGRKNNFISLEVRLQIHRT